MRLFDATTPAEEFTHYLRDQGLLQIGQEVDAVGRAGEGNMNVVLRLSIGNESLILKQSRDYVYKYPQISAPITRIEVEHTFYQITGIYPELASMMPSLKYYDRNNHILVMQDLGSVSDCTAWYRRDSSITLKNLEALLHYLMRLHRVDTTTFAFPPNLQLRKLNHEHLFIYPMVGEGLNLDEITTGLQAVADDLRRIDQLRENLGVLGDRYLATGSGKLLHGDFYPGSWMQIGDQVMVLDPEFAFVGPPEYDLGVFAAHLMMAGMAPQEVHPYFDKTPDQELYKQFCGMELIRRLIGLAQLPLDLDLNQKTQLLTLARSYLNA